jgi:hypothetical protein
MFRNIAKGHNSGYSPVACSCEHSNETLGSVKGGKCRDNLRKYYSFKFFSFKFVNYLAMLTRISNFSSVSGIMCIIFLTCLYLLTKKRLTSKHKHRE